MSNHIEWLLKELAGWEREGLIEATAGQRIRARYAGPVAGTSGWALLAFGVLGALLVGGGLILLLAHNWSDFSRAARTALAVTPLVLAQGAAVLGWLRGWQGVAWRESVATFWGLALGAALALVSQIYHLGGTFDGFLFLWLLLGLPVIYLLRSVLVGALYAAGALAWACQPAVTEDTVLGFWLWVAALAPFVRARWIRERFTSGTTFLLWVLSAVLTVGVSVSLARALPGLWIIVHASWFALLVLLDRRWFDDAPTLWHRPLHVAGWLGAVALALILTYDWPWRSIGWSHYRYDVAAWRQIADGVLTTVVAGSAALAAVAHRRVLRDLAGVAVLLPVAAVAGFWLASRELYTPALALLNGFVLLLGLRLMIGGVRRSALASLNAGMVLLGSLIMLRFFDSDFSLLSRGIAFVALGCAFLVVNLVLVRRPRSVS